MGKCYSIRIMHIRTVLIGSKYYQKTLTERSLKRSLVQPVVREGLPLRSDQVAEGRITLSS